MASPRAKPTQSLPAPDHAPSVVTRVQNSRRRSTRAISARNTSSFSPNSARMIIGLNIRSINNFEGGAHHARNPNYSYARPSGDCCGPVVGLSLTEVHRVAANIAKLPELVRKTLACCAGSPPMLIR